jgi:hypothetical protein
MALPEYKQAAKDQLKQIYNDTIVDNIKTINRLRVVYQDDVALKSAGAAIIDLFDDSYDDYAADIDAASDEAGVDSVMGSVSLPTL